MKNYINSLLSDISYLNFVKIDSGEYVISLSEAIKRTTYNERNINNVESQFFEDNFKVINQETNSVPGFSAITYEVTSDNVDGYKKGDIIVAFRGTESDSILKALTDLVYTDGLGIASGAIDGIGDAFTAVLEKIVETIPGVSEGNKFSFEQISFARNYINKLAQDPATQDKMYSVTGHSLGGYLANYVTVMQGEKIKESITFNAPAMGSITAALAFLVDKFKSSGMSTTQIESASNKIINYYSNIGGELVAKDQMWNSYFGARIPLYAEDMGGPVGLNNHFVTYSRQALMVYDMLAPIIDKGNETTLGNSKTIASITEMLNLYRYPAIEASYYKKGEKDKSVLFQMNISKHIDEIAKMLNFKSGDLSGFDLAISLMLYIDKNSNNISFNLLSKDKLTINNVNTLSERVKLYAAINYIPFYLISSNTSAEIMQEKYNPANYSNSYLDNRLYFANQIMNFKDVTLNSAEITEKDGNSSKVVLYTFFESNDTNSYKYNYVDIANKIVYLHNMTRDEFFSTNSDARYTYFLSDEKISIDIKGENSIVYDSLKDDYINIKSMNTSLYLTQGNDNITVNLNSGSIANLEILDGGKGDLITFYGTDNSDSINSTKYNDIVYGNLGSDTINGGDGNDTLYGNTRERQTGDLADTSTNIINGGYGADYIYGGEGTDIINYVDMNDGSYRGRKDNEAYDGKYGDTIEGRGGDDIIYGTFYGDTYNYTLGDGNDTIIERKTGIDTQEIFIDKLFIFGISQTSVSFKHDNTADLNLYLPDGNGGIAKITLKDFMKNTYVEKLYFNVDGSNSPLSYETILKQVLDRTAELGIPLVGNDLMSLEHTETLRGLKDAENTIIGGYGRDTIIGGDKDDIINESSLTSHSYLGKAPSDSTEGSFGDKITGGKGNDTIYGTQYSDYFYYNKGDGNDTITDNSFSLNSLVLGKGIDRANLRVTRDNNNSMILKFTFDDSSQNGQIVLSNNMGQNNYQILFDNGTKIAYTEMLKEALYYVDNDNSNTVYGTIYDDIIEGNGGDDVITGGRGTDVLRGGSGNDTLIGGAGSDTLEGGDGDDFINGYRNKNTVDAESYNNAETTRGDTITGGRGNDTIYGTYYGDTYYYNLGDGIDTMYELLSGDYLQSATYRDTLIFGEGIIASDIKLGRDGYDSVLEMIDGGKIIIKDFFKMNLIESFKFADNTVWSWEYIRDHTPLIGTDDDDTLIGFDNSIPDKIYGLGGDDKIYGQSGQNFLYGGDGNDTINEAAKVETGGNGNSYIEGNKGDDTLYGSTQATTFKFYLGDGRDTIIDSRTAFNNNAHVIEFGEGIKLDNISFARVNGSDLRIFYSSEDYVTIKNYYYKDNNAYYRSGPSYLKFTGEVYFDMYKNQDRVNSLIATNGDDTFYTLYEKEIVRGQAGNDRFIYELSPSFLTGAGSEYYGEEGDDYFNLKTAAVIDGGEGNDQIYAWSATLIDAGAGDDLIDLTSGGWKVIGGKGNDTFNLKQGQYGTNTYNLYFNVGDGRDVINSNGISRFNFYFNTASGDDFTDAKIVGSLFNNYVNIEYGRNSSILINTANLGHLSGYTTFNFTDRSLTIDNLYNNIYGTDDVDNYDIRNYINSAQIRAGGGNDYILGGYNNTVAYGESGNDYMMLRGGYNYFDGGDGNDTYQWESGYGQINDLYGINKLVMSNSEGYSANYRDMRLSRSGNDLLVQKLYNNRITGGILTIKDQFNGGGISYINSLSNANIDKMIELMAQYDSSSDSTAQANYSSEMSKLWYNQN